MCFDDIGDGIERGAEWLDNWGEENLGLPGMFTDFTTYDDEYSAGSGRVDLNDMPGGHPLKPLNVAPGSFTTVSFQDVWDHMHPAGEDVTSGHAGKWEDAANLMLQAVNNYQTFLHAIAQSDNNLVGNTAEAAIANINSSFAQIDGAAKAAQAMVHLAPAFGTTIGNVVREVVNRKGDYDDDMNSWPDHRDEIKRGYDTLAQAVMADYASNIGQIATRNPDMTGGKATPEHPGTPVPANTPTNFGGGSGGGGGGGLTGSGSGTPTFKAPTKTTSALDPASLSQTPQATPQSSVPELPTDALTDAAGAAQDAAGQATDAAKQALDQALSAMNPPPSPALPEGVLGLGPNGLNGAGAKGTGTGGGVKGGGSGGGNGGRSAPLARNAGLSTAATTSGSAATPAARAGLSSGAGGAPGAGAPAAGHRGNGADGTVHKANKALRRRKNGEEVMGDAGAVVAVVGADSESTAANPTTPEK